MKDIEQIIATQEEKWKKYANKHWQGNTENGKKIILHVDTDFGIDFHRSSIKEILEGVKQYYLELPSNYPVEVFTEPPVGWQKELDEWCKSKGFRIDNISAYYARWQEKLVTDDTINYIEEIIKKL